jgi:hypothetical protein
MAGTPRMKIHPRVNRSVVMTVLFRAFKLLAPEGGLAGAGRPTAKSVEMTAGAGAAGRRSR